MELLRHLEERARRRLPEDVYDYFAGGAGDEQTLADNEEAWRRVWLRPRQLAGVGEADPALTLLGARAAAPLALAPAAALRLLHPEGELAVARAAAAAGLPYCVSTRATTDLGEVAEVMGGAARWFQLYVHRDRARSEAVLARLAAQGYSHVVLTADFPIAGRRERELRHGPIELPAGVSMASHLGAGSRDADKPPVGGWATLAWEDVAWAGEHAGLPVVVKGLLTASDAERAVAHGAAAVVVSNHGGRQLDGVIPTAVALLEVAEAVGGRVPVLVDGGIRSGADVARALALGADAAMVARPYLWGLAADGEQGVRAVLDALVADVARTLVLLGASRPQDVGRAHFRLRGWDTPDGTPGALGKPRNVQEADGRAEGEMPG